MVGPDGCVALTGRRGMAGDLRHLLFYAMVDGETWAGSHGRGSRLGDGSLVAAEHGGGRVGVRGYSGGIPNEVAVETAGGLTGPSGIALSGNTLFIRTTAPGRAPGRTRLSTPPITRGGSIKGASGHSGRFGSAGCMTANAGRVWW